MNFVKGFEQVIIMFTVVVFLLLMVYMTFKHLKKLPESYSVEIIDVFGQKVILDGLRMQFRTFGAAKSYADFYSSLYGKQYHFRVVGRRGILENQNKNFG